MDEPHDIPEQTNTSSKWKIVGTSLFGYLIFCIIGSILFPEKLKIPFRSKDISLMVGLNDLTFWSAVSFVICQTESSNKCLAACCLSSGGFYLTTRNIHFNESSISN